MMKKCTCCGKEKEANTDNFPPYSGRSPDGLRPVCRVCHRVQDAAWRRRKRNNPVRGRPKKKT